MNRSHLALLEKIPLFAALGPAGLRRLLEGAVPKRFAAGKVVVHQGTASTHVFAIIRGQLRAVTRGEDGREATLGFMGAGEVFGEVSMLEGDLRSATVIAVDDCEVLLVDRRDFLNSLESSPGLAVKVIEVLARRLRRLTERSADIEFLSIPARLAKKLLELASSHGVSDGGRGTLLTLRLSQSELGELIGATRESVNKSLRQWVKAGWIQQSGGKLVILRLAELRAISEERETGSPKRLELPVAGDPPVPGGTQRGPRR